MRAGVVVVAAQIAAAAVGVSSAPETSSAQSSDSTASPKPVPGDREWLRAVSAGVPMYGGQVIAPALTFGAQWTSARPNRLGADFAFGTLPVGLAMGAGVFGGRAGLALPIRVTRGLLVIPSGGMSAIAVVSPYGGGAMPGYHAGAAIVILGPTGSGIRLGATEHRFPDLGGPFQLVELGFVSRPGR